ncbi:MAG: glycosyltransferase [Campylobacterota bacterium]
MKILMITNTYLPHVGGVANSVAGFKNALQAKGHRVMVIAPHFEGEKEQEDVLRVEAVQNFNGSDFSLSLPAVILKNRAIEAFDPDIIHSHHPFLLGISALRIAGRKEIPIVFTHHTLYERYTHYVPFESRALKKMAKKMATEYCNLCDGVIAPSASIASLLQKRGVTTPVAVIPTGIDRRPSGESAKEAEEIFGIGSGAFVIGHVSRLAPEKNQIFLAKAVALFLQTHPGALFVIAGSGEIEDELKQIFALHGVYEQVYFLGSQSGKNLQALYARMDLFVFSSTSETQGMVLAEAMLAHTPVVALDAPAVSEMVNENNGILVQKNDTTLFAAAMKKIHDMDVKTLSRLKQSSFDSAQDYRMDHTVSALIEFYKQRLWGYERKERDSTLLDTTLRTLTTEYEIWKSRAQSFGQSKVVSKSLGKLKKLGQNPIKKA